MNHTTEHNLIDAIPVAGFVQCSPMSDRPKSFNYGFGLAAKPMGDLARLLEPGQPVERFLRFGVGTIILHLPFGKPVASGDMPFDAYRRHNRESRQLLHDSLGEIRFACSEHGAKLIVYVGTPRSVNPRAGTPWWSPKIQEDRLWDHAVQCLIPVVTRLGVSLCLDAANKAMPHPALDTMVARLRDLMPRLGAEFLVEPPPIAGDDIMHGVPCITRGQGFTSGQQNSRGPAWMGSTPFVWRSTHGYGYLERGGEKWRLIEADALADAARRWSDQPTGIAVGYKIDESYADIHALRAAAKERMETLPVPYWKRPENLMGEGN